MYSANRTDITAVFFTILMVTSMMVVPFTAGAASMPSNHTESPSTTTAPVTPQVEEPDTNKIHVKKNLEEIKANMEVDTTPFGPDSPRSDEAWVDVYVNIEGEPNGIDNVGPYYPFRHNTDVQLTVKDTDGEVLQESTDFRLIPSGSEPYTATAKFNIRLSQESAKTYDFETQVRTKGGIDQFDTDYDANAHPVVELEESVEVTGASADTRSQSTLNIQKQEVFRELSSIAYMNSYKATTDPNEVDTMEDLSLPGTTLHGKVENFQGGAEKSSVDKGYTTFRSESGKMDIVTGTMPIEQNDPQTLIVQYLNTGTSPVNLDLINSSGNSIDPDTKYTLKTELTDEMEKYTFGGDLYNIATIRLSDDEQEFINNRGEAFVRYSSSNTSSIQVFCQSFVAGSLSFSDKACGLNSEQTDIESGLITDMVLTGPDGDTISFDEQKDFVVDPNEEVDVDFTVKNTGNSMLNESAYLFSNIGSGSAEAIESEEERFIEGVDYNESNDDYYKSRDLTVNFENEHNPDYVTLNVNGSSNQGKIIFEVNNGVTTESRSFPNIDNSDEINLGETFGFTNVSDTYTISVRSATRPFEGLSPQINSFQLSAEDPSVNTDFSPTNVSLASGETTTVSYTDINVGTVGKELLFKSMFMNDSKEIRINVASTFDQSKIQADAGGPYEVRLPVDRIYQEQIGTKTIEAAEKPAPTSEWERVSDTPVRTGSTATQTRRVEVQRVPQTVNPVASSEEINDAIDKWERDGFMQDLEAYFPSEADLSEWEPVRVEYQNKTDERKMTARKTEMENIFGADFLENNWKKTQEVGTDTIGYETRWETSIDGRSTEDTAQWNPVLRNQPKSVWDRNAKYQEGKYLKSTVTERITSIESGSTPLQCGSGVSVSDGYCNSLTDSSYWVRSDEPTRVVDVESDTRTIKQCTEINPGNAWELTEEQDCASETEEEYERIVSSVQRLYQWNEYKDNTYFLYYKPKNAAINEYVQDMYKTSIIFEKETSGDIYEYRGPVYDYTPVYEPVDLELDASGSIGAGEIQEYSWSFGEKTEDPKTTLRISEPENRSVELTITDETGRTDTDTAQINVLSGCSSGVCSWENGIQDLNLKTTDLVNYNKGQVNAEVSVQAQQLQKEWEIVLKPGESQNLRIDPKSTQCPDGYTSATDPSEVPDGYTFDGESGVVHCFYTGDAVLPEEAPEKFAHPSDPDSDTDAGELEYTTGNPDALVQIWQGDSIPNTATFTEQINPRLNNSIDPGVQEFEVLAQPVDRSRGIISDTDTTQLCLPDKAAGPVEPCDGGGGGDDGGDDDDGGDGIEPPPVPPTANFTFTPSNPETDEEITFQSTSADPDGSIVDYQWSYQVPGVSSGSSEESSFKYTYKNAGTWEVTLTVTDDDGKTDSITKSVQVTGEEEPAPKITIDPNPVNTGETVEFDGSESEPPEGESITGYSWSYEENKEGEFASGSGVTESTSYESTGEYVVTLTVTASNGTTGTTTKRVSVTEGPEPEPKPPVAIADVSTPVTVGDSVTFDGSGSTATGEGNEIVSYEWTYEDDNKNEQTNNSETFSETYDNKETYTYTLKVTENTGLTDTATGEFRVKRDIDPSEFPKIKRLNFVPTQNPEIGDDITVSAVVEPGPGESISDYSWEYERSDGSVKTSSNETFTDSWSSNGSYRVYLQVTNTADNTAATSGIVVVGSVPRPSEDPDPEDDDEEQITTGITEPKIPPECPEFEDLGPNETMPEECLNMPQNKIVYGEEYPVGSLALQSWALTGGEKMIEDYRTYTNNIPGDRYAHHTLVYDYNLGRIDQEEYNYYHFPLDYTGGSGEYPARGSLGGDIGGPILETVEADGLGGGGVSDVSGQNSPTGSSFNPYQRAAYLQFDSDTESELLQSGTSHNIVFNASTDRSQMVSRTSENDADNNFTNPTVSVGDTSVQAFTYNGFGLFRDGISTRKDPNTQYIGCTREAEMDRRILETFIGPEVGGSPDTDTSNLGSAVYNVNPTTIPCADNTFFSQIKGKGDVTRWERKTLSINVARNFSSMNQYHEATYMSPEQQFDRLHIREKFRPSEEEYTKILRQDSDVVYSSKGLRDPGEDSGEYYTAGIDTGSLEGENLKIGIGRTDNAVTDIGSKSDKVLYSGRIDDVRIYEDTGNLEDLDFPDLGDKGLSKHKAKTISLSERFDEKEVWKEGINVDVKADLSPTVGKNATSAIDIELMPVKQVSDPPDKFKAGDVENIGTWANSDSREVGNSDSTWTGTYRPSSIQSENANSDTSLERLNFNSLNLSESELEEIDGFKMKLNIRPNETAMISNSEQIKLRSVTITPKKIEGDTGDGGQIPTDLNILSSDLSYPDSTGKLTGTVIRGTGEDISYKDGKYDVKIIGEFTKDDTGETVTFGQQISNYTNDNISGYTFEPYKYESLSEGDIGTLNIKAFVQTGTEDLSPVFTGVVSDSFTETIEIEKPPNEDPPIETKQADGFNGTEVTIKGPNDIELGETANHVYRIPGSTEKSTLTYVNDITVDYGYDNDGSPVLDSASEVEAEIYYNGADDPEIYSDSSISGSDLTVPIDRPDDVRKIVISIKDVPNPTEFGQTVTLSAKTE